MANKKSKNNKKNKNKKENKVSVIDEIREEFKEGLKEGTRRVVKFIFYVLLVLILIFSAIGKAGIAGSYIYEGLTYLFGVGYYVIPFIFTFLAISTLVSLKENLSILKKICLTLFTISGLGLIQLYSAKGGVVGYALAYPLEYLLDFYLSAALLIALILISLFMIFDVIPSTEKLQNMMLAISEKFKKKEPEFAKEGTYTPDEDEEETEGGVSSYSLQGEADEESEQTKATPAEASKKEKDSSEENGQVEDIEIKQKRTKHYTPPPLKLLSGKDEKPQVGDLKANSNLIRRTLQNFGIDVEIDEVSVGPSVTRYALKPAEGVKLAKIVNLQSNLELALAAHPVRIEAPIPGRSLVGIEVPNSSRATVGIAGLLGSKQFKEAKHPLLIAMGKSISGELHFSSLTKMPHLLIAGATGAGKSVTIHSLVVSLLYNHSPDDLRMIMVDPKHVELTLYNKIPQLLTPVITDPKKAILALKWAAKEMERRYGVLEKESVRDISSYHQKVVNPAREKLRKQGKDESQEPDMPEPMPYIVIIIDEIADIMHSYPKELESAVVKLAQMSRAVGIHLVLYTQRPSVNVITGLIKANIPARISLQVSSQVDSRTILDAGGAEKLLGAGDLLFVSGEMAKPQRLQSAFISEDEVKKVVKHLAAQYEDELPDELQLTNNEESQGSSIFNGIDDDDEDELYQEARQMVIESGKASTSYLQRRLKIGYARAARLTDILEERGVIGPADGAKPREVLEKPSREGAEAEFSSTEEYDIKTNEEVGGGFMNENEYEYGYEEADND